MTPEAQRIAIAKACGWKRILTTTGYLGNAEFPEQIPDYLSDLNAMHEAEKMLNTSQMTDYKFNLSTICESDFHKTMCATAAQRACAFLRTLDLWQE